MATFGARTRVPTLWLYAENDSLFPPAVVARMHAAYTEAGGEAKLWMLPPILNDGHNLFADFGGRVKWLRALDRFMQANRMPNTNVARVENVMSTVKLADNTRPVVEEYLSTPSPKLLVAVASGKVAFWIANPTDIDGARKRVLARCQREVRRGMHGGDGEQRLREADRDRPAPGRDDGQLSAPAAVRSDCK